MYGGLVEFAGVLRDQLSHHLKVAELLDRDVLKHVTDAGVLDVETIAPNIAGPPSVAGGSAELLQEIRAEASIRGPYIDRLDKFFAM